MIAEPSWLPAHCTPTSPFNEKGHPPFTLSLTAKGSLTFEIKDALSYLWSFISGLTTEASARDQGHILSPLRSYQLPQVHTTGYVGAGTSPQTCFAWLTGHWLGRCVFFLNLHHFPTLKNQKLSHKKKFQFFSFS